MFNPPSFCLLSPGQQSLSSDPFYQKNRRCTKFYPVQMSDAFDRLDENNRMQSLKACRDKHLILFTKMTGKVCAGKPRSAPSTENYVTSCGGQENFLLRHRRWYLENQRHNRENHRQTVTTYRTNRILAPTADRQTETATGKRRSDKKYQYKHTKMKRTGKG